VYIRDSRRRLWVSEWSVVIATRSAVRLRRSYDCRRDVFHRWWDRRRLASQLVLVPSCQNVSSVIPRTLQSVTSDDLLRPCQLYTRRAIKPESPHSYMYSDHFRNLSADREFSAGRCLFAVSTYYRTQWTAQGSFLTFSAVCDFLFVYKISREPLNGFTPNSHRRRVWSLAWMSLNIKVKGQRSPGTKLHFPALSAACMRFVFGKTSSASW